MEMKVLSNNLDGRRQGGMEVPDDWFSSSDTELVRRCCRG